MIVLHEMRRRARFLVAPLVGVALTGYFAYHTIEGDRGLRAWREITRQLSGVKETLAAVEAERNALLQKVNALEPSHIDPDLLDQQIRSTLDFAAPNEIVIMRPAPPP